MHQGCAKHSRRWEEKGGEKVRNFDQFTLVGEGSLDFGLEILNMLKQHDKTAILLGLYMVSPTH